MTDAPLIPPADDQDWTWVLDRPCPDCGFDSAAVSIAGLPDQLRQTARRWQSVLGRSDVATRPAEQVWSPLEYAAHVRDVYDIFGERAQLMLSEHAPRFANWDQDAAAVAKRYWESDPATVSMELHAAAGSAARVFEHVRPDQLGRPGYRSNGSVFTVQTLGAYFLHDVVHHLHDVEG